MKARKIHIGNSQNVNILHVAIVVCIEIAHRNSSIEIPNEFSSGLPSD